MVIAVVVLAVLVIVLCGVAAYQHTQLLDLRARVPLPDTTAAAGAPDSTADAHDAIVVVIRNHHDVAAGRTRLARGLSALSPALVRRLVHRETVRELREQLSAEGIDADVRVRRIVPRDPGA